MENIDTKTDYIDLWHGEQSFVPTEYSLSFTNSASHCSIKFNIDGTIELGDGWVKALQNFKANNISTTTDETFFTNMMLAAYELGKKDKKVD